MTYETPLTNAQMYVTAHLLVWHFCHFTWRRKGQVIMLQLPIQFRMSAIITSLQQIVPPSCEGMAMADHIVTWYT